MDWMNRGARTGQTANQPAAHSAGIPGAPAPHQNKNDKLAGLKSLRFASVALLFSATILVVALLAYLAFGGGSSSSQSKNIDKSKLQAVFLNGGQVYFGKINSLSDKYITMSDIYYLRVNQQVQPNQEQSQASANDISLVKLGCELHGPQDKMVINNDQVIFWENLKDDGQVAKAVAEYVKQNPQGQKCDQPAQSNTNGSTNNTNATTNNSTQTNTNATTNNTQTNTNTNKKP
jgi:hypothetical protein